MPLEEDHALALGRLETALCQRLKLESSRATFMSAKRPPMSIATSAVMSAIVKRSPATNSRPFSSRSPVRVADARPHAALHRSLGIACNDPERLDSYFESCVRLPQTAPVPSAGSTSRSAPVRAGRARTGLARDEAPPDSGRSRPTRRDMTRRRTPAPALHRMGSLQGIRGCDFDQREYRDLAAQARFLFPPRRCEPGADLEPLHDCKASWHLPF